MQQFLFSDGLSAEVKRRLDSFNDQQRTLNAWLEGIMVATAQANGAATTDVVRLNAEGTGVVVVSPDTPADGGELDAGYLKTADTTEVETDEARRARLERARRLINEAKKQRPQTVTTDNGERRL